LRIIPRCITDLAALLLPKLGIWDGRIACTFSGAVAQAHLIKGLNLMIRVKCRCCLHLGIILRCISDLAGVSSPEFGMRSGHIACTFCGAVAQAHLTKGLNLMLRAKLRCFLCLLIIPKCITDLAAVLQPELGIRSGRIACTCSGAVEQAHLMTCLHIVRLM
jgi:hypothetical protein